MKQGGNKMLELLSLIGWVCAGVASVLLGGFVVMLFVLAIIGKLVLSLMFGKKDWLPKTKK